MFCTTCGTKVDQEDTFCRKCGARLERRSAAGTGTAQAVIGAPARESTPPTPRQASSSAEARVSAAPRKQRKGNKAVIGAVGASVFLIAAAGMYLVAGSPKSSAKPMSSAQWEEPRAPRNLQNEPLSRPEESQDLPPLAGTRPDSLQRSEIVEAPRVAELTKPAGDAIPPQSKSQMQRGGLDSARIARPVPQAASRAGGKLGVYETVHNTTVYENPSDSANVVADIPAGIRLNVVSATGDWLEVHSRRGNPPGFIRRGDAVFIESLN